MLLILDKCVRPFKGNTHSEVNILMFFLVVKLNKIGIFFFIYVMNLSLEFAAMDYSLISVLFRPLAATWSFTTLSNNNSFLNQFLSTIKH